MSANPWSRLPTAAPFILRCDHALTQWRPRSADHVLHLNLLPEPFVGRPDASVVLLALNPGYSPDDAVAHAQPDFAARLRANLLHEPHEHPFYLLDPNVQAPGRRWWEQKLRELISATDRQRVTNGLCCIEYFPYHSRHYSGATPRVPSQSYSFELVRQAMQRNAAIVLLRSHKLWDAAIPDLAKYANRYQLNSAQNVSFTPRNCPAGFDAVVARL